MPRYMYRCEICDEHFCVQHLSTETATACVGCNSGDIKKILTSFSTPGKSNIKLKVGQQTEDFIKKARIELKNQKEDMKDKR